MELGLAGKTVIVTGGASNIGRGISLAFAQEKSNVVIADIDEEQGQKVAKEATALGGKSFVIKADVTSYDSVEAVVKKTLGEWGQIDVLVNNVGWVATKPFIDKPREEWEKEIRINYLGMVNCTRAVLNHMIERKCGRIVSVASEAGRVGEQNQAVYSGAKGAVIAFSKALAREVGRHGITVNCITPGITIPESPEEAGEHSMWRGLTLDVVMPPEVRGKVVKSYPLGRLGKAEDIAKVAVFLASDAASFVTGQTLSVSGGFTMV